MTLVILTALGVGLATLFGGVLGFIFKDVAMKYGGAMMALSSGVMLACSFTSLIMPAFGLSSSPYTVALGIMLGGGSIFLFDKVISHFDIGESDDKRHVVLFVLAMALHNIPEGIASGVGFGLGDTSAAISIAVSVAVQNIPEGMVIIAPLLSLGIGKKRAFLIALMTGGVEVVGAFLGYFFISGLSTLLPLALSFAGGTMVYVIYAETPGDRRDDYGMWSMIFLLGTALMLLFSAII
jgi:ZIP family zinc transporter